MAYADQNKAMSRYTIGRSYEYKAKKQLEATGYTVVRSAGSHSEWDLIAFKTGEPVRCIQIKYTKSSAMLKRLLKSFRPLIGEGGNSWVSELWVWYRGEWYAMQASLETERSVEG